MTEKGPSISPLGNAAGSSAEPVIDLDVALERFGGSQELIHQLIVMYGEDAPPLFEELRAGITERNIGQVKRSAHTLKGLAANFEARPAAKAAFQVEQLAQAGDLEAVARQVPEMERQFERLQRALDRHVASSS